MCQLSELDTQHEEKGQPQGQRSHSFYFFRSEKLEFKRLSLKSRLEILINKLTKVKHMVYVTESENKARISRLINQNK